MRGQVFRGFRVGLAVLGAGPVERRCCLGWVHFDLRITDRGHKAAKIRRRENAGWCAKHQDDGRFSPWDVCRASPQTSLPESLR